MDKNKQNFAKDINVPSKEQTNDSLKNSDKNFNENCTHNKEQIIVDGVDVSGCKCLPYCNDKQGNCAYEPNCYFKQLARKTQECEQKEKELLSNEKIINKLMKEVDELKQECEELKRKLSNQEQLYQNEIEIYNESCLQLRQENDDLYLERLALNTANSGINSLLEIKEQENDRYHKALEEIELTIKNLEKGDILTFPDFTLQENATMIINQCNQGYRDILDIINKALRNDKH